MSTKYLLACDLGTGGNKACLYRDDGTCLAQSFKPYQTFYPHSGWHEQKPMDWWEAVVDSIGEVVSASGINPNEVAAIGLSGHSLGVVPVSSTGELLRETSPIWSDSRARKQAAAFFQTVGEQDWYLTTGNGFPAAHYSIFKIQWYRENEPELFKQTHKFIGTKDFINCKLTGRLVTDHSYASGCGAYDLRNWGYSQTLIQASGLPREVFPDPVPSTEIIGELTRDAARELGLPAGVKVVAGGVDNSCMALGARNIADGTVYNSLGSSSWIAVTSVEPVLDTQNKPFVFSHVIPGMFNSALAIFSAGSSFLWLRDQVCAELIAEAEKSGADPCDLMTALASTSPVGANGLIFNPNLAGGSSLDANPNMRGAFAGLDLGHSKADLIRAVMEGVALGLRQALNELRKLTRVADEMIVVGGMAQGPLWREILADAYNLDIVKTNINQEAAVLGAAAVAAVGSGIWDGFGIIEQIHQVEDIAKPDAARAAKYAGMQPVFQEIADFQAAIAPKMAAIFS